MKIRLLFAPVICALFALVLNAQDAKKEDQTEMGAKMEKASGAWRAAKKQSKDSTKNEDTLAKLATVKENLEAANKFEPAKAKDVPEADRAKFIASFHDDLKAEIARVDKVIAAIKAGDNDGAQKLMADVDQAQKDAHGEYRKKKEKKN